MENENIHVSFKQAKLKMKISIRPDELHDNFINTVKSKINEEYGKGICLPRIGYIKKNSIVFPSDFYSKTCSVDPSDFTGCVNYMANFLCKITYPTKDTRLSCRVINITMSGITAEPISISDVKLPYIVLLPKEIHLIEEQELLLKLNKNDIIDVKIVESSFVPEKLGKSNAYYLVLAKILNIHAKIDSHIYQLNEIDFNDDIIVSYEKKSEIIKNFKNWIDNDTYYNDLINIKRKIGDLNDEYKIISEKIPNLKIRDKIWANHIRFVINEHELLQSSKKYFKSIVDDSNIISRAYYKLREVVYKFKLIEKIKTSDKFLFLGESPGGFIQSLLSIKNSVGKNDSENTFVGVSLGKEDIWSSKRRSTKSYLEKTLAIEELLENKTEGRTNFTTKGYNFWLYGTRDNDKFGNLYNTETLNAINIDINNKFDIITADGGFVDEVEDEKVNDDDKEMEHYQLFFSEIFYALSLQKDNGCFILKIYDIFTNTTIQFLALLRKYYENVFLFKPFTSRPANSEKYVICTGFRGISSEILSILGKVHDKLNSATTEEYLNSFINLSLDSEGSQDFINTIKAFNETFIKNQISNIQIGLDYGTDYISILRSSSTSSTDKQGNINKLLEKYYISQKSTPMIKLLELSYIEPEPMVYHLFNRK